MELKIKEKLKGTRIIFGEEANKRKELYDTLYNYARLSDFSFIELPSLEKAQIYIDKAGDEVLNQMYTFKDKKDRELCLRPEGTATIQLIANQIWKYEKDLKLFYFTKCWRYERPQRGRYREFYQFGLEWINPTNIEEANQALKEIAEAMVGLVTDNYVINDNVKRGLNYYTDTGFEIECPDLGAQKQVVGGGKYTEGVGFGLGFDRLALLWD